jgi:hypothetical protein
MEREREREYVYIYIERERGREGERERGQQPNESICMYVCILHLVEKTSYQNKPAAKFNQGSCRKVRRKVCNNRANQAIGQLSKSDNRTIGQLGKQIQSKRRPEEPSILPDCSLSLTGA